jgi:hypothetical protein
MATKRETILSRLVTQLSGTTGCGSRIYRSRVTAINNRSGNSLVIEPVSDTCDINVSTPKCDWTLLVKVSIIAVGDASTSADEAADSSVESMYAKMTSDLTVNNNALDVQCQSTDFELVDADQPTAVVSTNFVIKYRTDVDSISS